MSKKRPDDSAERRSKRRSARGSKASESGASRRPAKSKFREWLDALVFAVIVMVILRTLFFDLFRIPTPSMEKTLMVGDYLFVSKLHYGTRTPMTLGIPFTSVYLPGLQFPFTRFPGFSEVKRGDSVVFNWPADNVSAIDRRQHYIKRFMGLPGETLEVRDKVVYIDGEAQPLAPGMQEYWNIYKTEPRVQLSRTGLHDLGVTEIAQTSDPSVLRVVATEPAVEQIRSWPWVDRVEAAVMPSDPRYSALMYPPGHGYTPDNYGPVHIPAKGLTVTLDDSAWDEYRTVITRYEHHTAERAADGSFIIDGQPATEYTFEQDYFFAMGDNRDNSEDSRFWGFVPMDHVVGRAIMVYFSWDKESRLPRIGRIFSFIH